MKINNYLYGLISPKNRDKTNKTVIPTEIFKEGETIYIDGTPYVRVIVRLSGTPGLETEQFISQLETENEILKSENEEMLKKINLLEDSISKYILLNKNLIEEKISAELHYNYKLNLLKKRKANEDCEMKIEGQKKHIVFIEEKLAEYKSKIIELNEAISKLNTEKKDYQLKENSSIQVRPDFNAEKKLLNELKSFEIKLNSYFLKPNENISANDLQIINLIKQFQKMNKHFQKTHNLIEAQRLHNDNTFSSLTFQLTHK